MKPKSNESEQSVIAEQVVSSRRSSHSNHEWRNENGTDQSEQSAITEQVINSHRANTNAKLLVNSHCKKLTSPKSVPPTQTVKEEMDTRTIDQLEELDDSVETRELIKPVASYNQTGRIQNVGREIQTLSPTKIPTT